MATRIATYILASPGTSSVPSTFCRWLIGWGQTSGGTAVARREDTGVAIAELRRLSGLTWEQLARLFAVTRRSLHFWASGKQLTSANEERLNRMLAVIRKIDRGSASSTRAALFQPSADGHLPFDMLVDGRYEALVESVGLGGVLPRPAPQRLSKAAQAARVPSAPEQLADARHERVHVERGRLLSGRPIRGARGK
jgi:transcriptional regulator with XRE-family HTH domain